MSGLKHEWIAALLMRHVNAPESIIYDVARQIHTRALSAAPQPAPAVGVKPLGWRYYPDAFPPMWVSQGAAFGNYSIEEAAGSDSPTYDVLNPTMGLMANCDGLPDAKAAAQSDYETRIRSALSTPEE